MHHVSVDLVETDEALEAARASGAQVTRAGFIRRAAVGSGAMVAGGLVIAGMPSVALGKPSAKQDGEILNFALLLEYLEAAFYDEALSRGAIGGETKSFARVVGAHENAHVDFLREALGSSARKKPEFDFRDTTSDPDKFRATAVLLEDTGVAAYNGQGPRLTKGTLALAAQIVSVEARHAAWIRRITNGPDYGSRREYPAPVAFDKALTKRQVEEAVEDTGFIKG